ANPTVAASTPVQIDVFIKPSSEADAPARWAPSAVRMFGTAEPFAPMPCEIRPKEGNSDECRRTRANGVDRRDCSSGSQAMAWSHHSSTQIRWRRVPGGTTRARSSAQINRGPALPTVHSRRINSERQSETAPRTSRIRLGDGPHAERLRRDERDRAVQE